MAQSYWFASSLFLEHFPLWSRLCVDQVLSPTDYKLKNSALTATSKQPSSYRKCNKLWGIPKCQPLVLDYSLIVNSPVYWHHPYLADVLIHISVWNASCLKAFSKPSKQDNAGLILNVQPVLVPPFIFFTVLINIKMCVFLFTCTCVYFLS